MKKKKDFLLLSIFENIRNKFNFILITSCKNEINNDNFDKYRFSMKNLHKKPFNKSYEFEKSIDEHQLRQNSRNRGSCMHGDAN